MNTTVTVDITKQEQKIVSMLADGMTNEEVAKKIRMNEKTLATWLYNLRNKTGCKNSTHLVALFFRKKILR